MTSSPQQDSGAAALGQAVLFLARFFGCAVQAERLRASLAARPDAGAAGAPPKCRPCC